MIQLTRDGLVCSAVVKALAVQFAQTHTVRLPQLLDVNLLQLVSARLECARWIPYEHHGIGREVYLSDPVALHALHFAVNTGRFIRLVEEITGCHPIIHFLGRFYRIVPATDQGDSWHDDNASGDRLVGMSINLSPRPYKGGVFRLRKKDSHDILCELPNVNPGDAILFRISRELEHMVTPLEGDEPRTAFAGWFISSGVDFFSSVRQTRSVTSAIL
jgi:hypothetical protein